MWFTIWLGSIIASQSRQVIFWEIITFTDMAKWKEPEALNCDIAKLFRKTEHWHRWNDLRGVIDTADINVTPLKSLTDFTSPFSSFKGKIQQKYFNGKYRYPHTIQVLEAEKSWGLPGPHFRFLIFHFRFWRLSKRLPRRIRCHMQNGVSLFFSDIPYTGMGLIDEKKSRSKISCNCPFKCKFLKKLWPETKFELEISQKLIPPHTP
jgi:hypothetical protein